MPSIKIPAPLRNYTDSQSVVAVSGTTVGAAVTSLTEQHPKLRQHLYTDSGELRAFVNLFLAGEDVRYLQGLDTELNENDELRIVPSVAGG